MLRAAAILCGLWCMQAASLHASTTIDPAHPYAYGANVGWVNARGDGAAGAVIGTAYCTGTVWSANCGWISLSNVQAHVRTATLASGPDSDADGLPDADEYRRAGNLTTLAGGAADWDEDGATDTEELAADTDPLDDGDFFAITAGSAWADSGNWSGGTYPTRRRRMRSSPPGRTPASSTRATLRSAPCPAAARSRLRAAP